MKGCAIQGVRVKVLRQLYQLGATLDQLAKFLRVSGPTISLAIQRLKKAEPFSPRPTRGGNPNTYQSALMEYIHLYDESCLNEEQELYWRGLGALIEEDKLIATARALEELATRLCSFNSGKRPVDGLMSAITNNQNTSDIPMLLYEYFSSLPKEVGKLPRSADSVTNELIVRMAEGRWRWSIVAGVSNDEIQDLLATFERSVKEREWKVLRFYFGLDGGTPMNLEEIGALLCITRERARQIKEKALSRCRNLIGSVVMNTITLRQFADKLTQSQPQHIPES